MKNEIHAYANLISIHWCISNQNFCILNSFWLIHARTFLKQKSLKI